MFSKRNYIYLTILSFIFIFASCTQPASSSSSDDDNSYNYSPAQIAELKGYYSKLIGTCWENEELNNSLYVKPKNILTVAFASDSVTINNVRYTINQNTDLCFNDKVTDEVLKNCSSPVFFIKINNNFYGFSKYLFNDNTYDDSNLDVESLFNGSYCYETLIPSSTGSGGGSGNNNTISGSYSFNNATGSQSNGTITLSDGNWSYSGSKSNPAASSGTYTVNGSKITVSWTASGYNNSETFTVTTSGSSSTWKSENTGVSLLFSMLFGTTSLEMTFNFAE